MKRWYLMITEKFLFWTFRWCKIGSFFEPRNWWKDDISWLLRSSCFEIFGDEKCGLFFSQKFDGKIIFTWSFFSFPWYSRTWEIWFFCSVFLLLFQCFVECSSFCSQTKILVIVSKQCLLDDTILSALIVASKSMFDFFTLWISSCFILYFKSALLFPFSSTFFSSSDLYLW